MNKQEFISYIAENCDYDTDTAETIIDVFAGSICLAISEGHEVNLDNLGKFAVKGVSCRKNHYQSTLQDRKTRLIKKRPYFTPAQNLKIVCA